MFDMEDYLKRNGVSEAEAADIIKWTNIIEFLTQNENKLTKETLEIYTEKDIQNAYDMYDTYDDVDSTGYRFEIHPITLLTLKQLHNKGVISLKGDEENVSTV